MESHEEAITPGFLGYLRAAKPKLAAYLEAENVTTIQVTNGERRSRVVFPFDRTAMPDDSEMDRYVDSDMALIVLPGFLNEMPGENETRKRYAQRLSRYPNTGDKIHVDALLARRLNEDMPGRDRDVLTVMVHNVGFMVELELLGGDTVKFDVDEMQTWPEMFWKYVEESGN